MECSTWNFWLGSNNARHRATLAGTYDFPLGKGRKFGSSMHPVINGVVGGWQVSGIYTYCIFDHPTNYPATGMGEARFYVKLNDAVFDWMTVDRNRNMKMITASDWNA